MAVNGQNALQIRVHFVVIKKTVMKKLFLSMLLVGTLAVTGFSQTTQKTQAKTDHSKSTAAQQPTKSKTVTKTSTSSSAAGAGKSTTSESTAMTKPKHKHSTTHKTKQKTTK